MRLSSIMESAFFLLTLMLTSFLFFDEEPVLDWSDVNFIHIAAMVVAALVVYYDLLTRARVGQYVMKDLNVAAAALTFI